MKLRARLLLIPLASLALVLTPAASAGHCAEQPLVKEVTCTVLERVGDPYRPVDCVLNTAPSQWHPVCVGIA